jgi:hypothetical protein
MTEYLMTKNRVQKYCEAVPLGDERGEISVSTLPEGWDNNKKNCRRRET